MNETHMIIHNIIKETQQSYNHDKHDKPEA